MYFWQIINYSLLEEIGFQYVSPSDFHFGTPLDDAPIVKHSAALVSGSHVLKHVRQTEALILTRNLGPQTELSSGRHWLLWSIVLKFCFFTASQPYCSFAWFKLRIVPTAWDMQPVLKVDTLPRRSFLTSSWHWSFLLHCSYLPVAFFGIKT